jgi:hypothetical protein
MTSLYSSNITRSSPQTPQTIYAREIVKDDKPSDSVKNSPYTQQHIDRDIKTFRTITTDIITTYWSLTTQISTALDIISIYLKGQKLLYIEAKNYSEWYLNFMMVPAICISATSSILSAGLELEQSSGIIVASLTGLNSFILAMINYLKLDAKAEAFRVTSYKFDKLQTKCEFYSGRIMYSMNNEKLYEEITKFIEEIEKEIHDIKEVNQFIIPESIRYRYPKLFSTNIFAEIKKLTNLEKIYTQQLNNVYNEIEDLVIDKNQQINGIISPKMSLYSYDEKIQMLNDKKKAILKQIILHRDKYLDIDNDLTKEIADYIYYKNSGIFKRLFNCRTIYGYDRGDDTIIKKAQIIEEINKDLSIIDAYDEKYNEERRKRMLDEDKKYLNDYDKIKEQQFQEIINENSLLKQELDRIAKYLSEREQEWAKVVEGKKDEIKVNITKDENTDIKDI